MSRDKFIFFYLFLFTWPLFLNHFSCSKFASFNQTMEDSAQWTHFAPIAKLESLDEIDQDSNKHSTAGLPSAAHLAPTTASAPNSMVVAASGSSGALSPAAITSGEESAESSSSVGAGEAVSAAK